VHPVILDTDVASRLHRRKLTGPLATRLIGREPLITFVTLGELTKWAEIRDGGNYRRSELASWLSAIPVLPGDDAVAEAWGILSAAATRRGRPARQRHVDRGMLPCPPGRARNVEPQGLPGLRRASRPAHAQLTTASAPTETSPI
jgi:predicted nucleic acid-binding protein